VTHYLLLPDTYPVALRTVRLIWFLVTVVESVVGLRVLFRLLASTEAGFVRFIYTVSGPVVAPFRPIASDLNLGRRGEAGGSAGSSPAPAPTTDGRRIEVSSLIAMLLVFLGAYLLVTLIDIIFMS
jgi:hypothetical protein